MIGLLINKKLDNTMVDRLRTLDNENGILFVIAGDLSLSAKYANTFLAVSEKKLFVYNADSGETEREILISDIEEISIKRLYGNAFMRAIMKDKSKIDVFRFTFNVTALCDAAVNFINGINSGEAAVHLLDAVEAVYEKQLSVCPKCGRTLSSAGAKCINCTSKKQIIGKLAVYMKPEAKNLIISVLLSVITTALALIPPIVTKQMVDEIIPNYDKKRLLFVVIELLVINVIYFSITGIRGYMLRVSGNRIVASLRNTVYEKAQYLPMKFYDKTSTGSVINRIAGDTNTLQAFMLRVSQEVVVQFFMLVGIMVIMLFMDWKLAILSLLPVPAVIIGAKIFSRKIAPFYRRIWRKWAAVSSILTDSIPCIRVVKSFSNEKNTVSNFEKYNDEWLKTDTKAAKTLNAFPALVSFFVAIGSLVIWGAGGTRVINSMQNGISDNLTLGLLVSFISYVSMFYAPINFFAYLSDSYQGALSSAERIFDILDAEPEHDFGHGNIPDEIKGKIEFKNVNFSFDKGKKILKDVNFTINEGDIVGIVGTTGSGKSTLINLFLRFYDSYDGQILVDGKNIRDIDMSYFRSQIGYVQQEPMMFHDTIFNNISYGAQNVHIEQVINAADTANAHEFIARQPDAYDTVLGERGVGLSGGERQRISIARAVLKNPSILIFDEATASVDSETEHLIQEAIERLIKGRTTIMIAHRLSTLSKANKIIVVDDGKIIEDGTPDELIRAKGKYYKLVKIQSMADNLQKTKAEENFD